MTSRRNTKLGNPNAHRMLLFFTRHLLGVGMLVGVFSAISARANPQVGPHDDNVLPSHLTTDLKHQQGDVDQRLNAALQHWRNGEIQRARQQAQRVVELAPHYIDAHMLLARIDGVEKRYEAALARVKKVLAVEPTRIEGLRLWADLGLWSGQYHEAKRAIERMAQIEITAEIYYRKAQIAYAQRHVLMAYRQATHALSLDKKHLQSKTLVENTRFAVVDMTSDVELFPKEAAGKQTATGQTVSAAVLPSNHISGALSYEYRHRFAKNNHRVGLRLNWRLLKQLTLTGYGRAGWVAVLPWLTTYLAARYEFDNSSALRLRYTYDKLRSGGQLHRAQLAGEIPLTEKLRVMPALEIGAFETCGKYTWPLWGPRLQMIYERGRTHLTMGYGYAMELGFSEYLSTSHCPTSTGAQLNPLLPVAEPRSQTRYHEGGLSWLLRIAATFSVRAGYGIQFRTNGGTAHMLHAGVQKWF